MAAQTSIIKINGVATLKVAPDTMRVVITVSRHFNTNDEAYEQAKLNSLDIQSGAKELGLEEDQVKSVAFDVREDSKPIYEDGHWVGYRKNGYDLYQQFTVEFPIEAAEINSFVKYCTEKIAYAEVKLNTFISDPRKYKFEAINKAVKDAREKAQVIAASLGCTLGAILEVTYGNEESRAICYDDCDGSIGALPGDAALVFNGEEEDICEGVIIKWELHNPW